MKLLIDANIILDVLQNRKPHVEQSSIIWKLCETKQAEGYLSALTFANLVYILRKGLTPQKVNEVLKALQLIFEFADLNSSDLVKAAELQWDDYEAALQSVIAERVQANFIITRSIRDFKNSQVMALTPSEYIARL